MHPQLWLAPLPLQCEVLQARPAVLWASHDGEALCPAVGSPADQSCWVTAAIGGANHLGRGTPVIFKVP